MNPRNLTREDIEELNDIEPYCFETDREEQWFNVGLQYGLDVADSDPISPWISVNDDLPCNHKELMENEYKTKKVLAVMRSDKSSSKNIEICYMTNQYCSIGNWYWINTLKTHVTHWMPLPELPKNR